VGVVSRRIGGLLSQLRQFRVLRESRLSFESGAMRDAMREAAVTRRHAR